MLIMHQLATFYCSFLDAASTALSAMVLVKSVYRDQHFPDRSRRVRYLDPLEPKGGTHATVRLAQREIVTSGFYLSSLVFATTMLFQAVPRMIAPRNGTSRKG